MSMVTLAAAQEYLNTTDDAELQSFLDRAEATVVNDIGPLAATSKTEWVSGHGTALWLSCSQVTALTSVTSVEGTVVPTSSLTVLDGGRVEYTRQGYFPSRLYRVVYGTGWAVLPAELELAVLARTRLLWSSQRHLWADGGRFSATAQGPTPAPAIPGLRWSDTDRLLDPYRTPILA